MSTSAVIPHSEDILHGGSFRKFNVPVRMQVSPAFIVLGQLLFLALNCPSGIAQDAARGISVPQTKLVRVQKIWDKAPHNAFTDLTRWKDRFFCAFREGAGHAGDQGKLRVLESRDGQTWTSTGLLSHPDFDLRDAAICVTPEDQLMLMGGAQYTRDGKRRTGTFVSFSTEGQNWSAPEIVIPPGRWLWRVTWKGKWAYGVAYPTPEDSPFSSLHRTSDGMHYETVVPELLGEGGRPTEARIRFSDDGTAYCLHRRDGKNNSAYLGTASPPYTNWTWKDLEKYFGGPNFIEVPGVGWIGCGRIIEGSASTQLVLLDMQAGTMSPLLKLPSGGDTSYPGLVWFEGQLWITYYSSHESKTSIYCAQVEFGSKKSPTP